MCFGDERRLGLGRDARRLMRRDEVKIAIFHLVTSHESPRASTHMFTAKTHKQRPSTSLGVRIKRALRKKIFMDTCFIDLKNFIIHSKCFPDSDWLTAHV